MIPSDALVENQKEGRKQAEIIMQTFTHRFDLRLIIRNRCAKNLD